MIRPLVALLALLAFVSPALAWDLAGHMLIGEIAWRESTPAIRAKVEALAAKLDTTFSGGRPYNFTTANCWLDDMRRMRSYPWGKLHYVNIEKSADGSGFALPEPPHAVWAIQDALKTLRDPATPAAKRPEALGILIHCIGDIHQPLHACTWDDRGGNGYLLAGVAFSDLYRRGRGNLHAFWDEAYRVEARGDRIVEIFTSPPLTARPAPGQPGIIADTAASFMAAHPRKSFGKEIASLDSVAWARESHVLACQHAYPPGPHPRDTAVRKLEPEFAAGAKEIATRRVVLAGYRLARVLASLFGGE